MHLEPSSSSAPDPGRPRHHLTIDVEEIFHSTVLAERIPPDQWGALPRRAPEVTGWLLDEMAKRGATGTFFVLGWLAELEPELVRRISDAGHEIAAHSWWHRKVTDLEPEELRSDLRRTKALLEDLTGREVLGFRAPSFSIRPGVEWAFEVMIEEGYRYDSSLFPIRLHPDYGYPEAKTEPFLLQTPGGSLLEFPLLTLDLAGTRLPAAGGAYLRLLPLALPRQALKQAEKRGVAGTVYVHPWDLDPGAHREPLPPLVALRLHGGANAARRRLRKLLRGFRFTAISESLPALEGLRVESSGPHGERPTDTGAPEHTLG